MPDSETASSQELVELKCWVFPCGQRSIEVTIFLSFQVSVGVHAQIGNNQFYLKNLLTYEFDIFVCSDAHA